MPLAEESSFLDELQDLFWKTQLGSIDPGGFSIELWSRDRSLLKSKGSDSEGQEELPLYFEDDWVGSLRSGPQVIKLLAAEKHAGERLAAFLHWSEASLTSKLHLIHILDQIQSLSSDFNWVGLYRLDASQPSELIVSCFLGPATPHRRISIHHGICGAAIREKTTLNIADVSKDTRYLSCSAETKSELVIPIRNASSEVVAELDIDCRVTDGFSGALEKQVHRLCERIEKIPQLFGNSLEEHEARKD
jgi:GAF domain-containing protein